MWQKFGLYNFCATSFPIASLLLRKISSCDIICRRVCTSLTKPINTYTISSKTYLFNEFTKKNVTSEEAMAVTRYTPNSMYLSWLLTSVAVDENFPPQKCTPHCPWLWSVVLVSCSLNPRTKIVVIISQDSLFINNESSVFKAVSYNMLPTKGWQQISYNLRRFKAKKK